MTSDNMPVYVTSDNIPVYMRSDNMPVYVSWKHARVYDLSDQPVYMTCQINPCIWLVRSARVYDLSDPPVYMTCQIHPCTWLVRSTRLIHTPRIAVCNTWSSGGTALCRVEGATSQLDLPSLTPLSVAGSGWLQLGAPHWATSVITASSWKLNPHSVVVDSPLGGSWP